ncbi:MAG: pseudouridine synthase [Kiritimatiellia bacterium]|nr:pseudouridine synthase [Kiritimatiellia bacterium]
MVTAPLDCQKQNPRSDIRLQKFLALCGLGSRRACERLIDEGRVAVDGKTVACQGVKINPSLQIVKIDGRRVVPEPKITLLFNKPRDVICTSSDPEGRKTFHSYLPELPARVFTVGRLDRASEGLLIITSDGELAQAVAHPRNRVEKTYLVAVGRALTTAELKRLRDGIQSEGELLRIASIRPAEPVRNRYVYEVKIQEGKNRHIRRMFAGLNLDVLELRRIAIGPLKLGNLRAGQWRYMTDRERDALRGYMAKRQEGRSGH